MKGCFNSGAFVAGNTEMVDVGNLTNSTFAVTKTCNSSGDEFFFKVTNSQNAIIQVNASVSSLNLPENLTIFDAYNGTYFCSSVDDCGSYFNGPDSVSFEIPAQSIDFWFSCSSDSSWNTSLIITASFISTIPDQSIESSITGLQPGGIVGIVIGSFAFLLIVFVSVYYYGSSKKGCWCRNRTSSAPDESPRQNDIERKETGVVAGNHDIVHSPSSSVAIQPHKTNLNGPMIDDELINATSSLEKPDMNSTGHHLIGDNQATGYHPNAERSHIDSYSIVTANTPSVQGGLPEIHVDRRLIA